MEKQDIRNLISALKDIAKSLSEIHAELKAIRNPNRAGDQHTDEREG